VCVCARARMRVRTYMYYILPSHIIIWKWHDISFCKGMQRLEKPNLFYRDSIVIFYLLDFSSLCFLFYFPMLLIATQKLK